jgi:alpha-beta hydrolase superfamily lysophospholipase
VKKINITAKDGATIPAMVSNMDNSGKKGIVLICHGFGEHSGSYTELAGLLGQAGFASVIPDQRGHGTPPDGAKKWFGIIPDYQCFLDDVVSLTEAVKEIAPGIPIAIYGHSMGGNIVANTLLHYDLGYICAVLESPWFELFDPLGPLKTCIIRLLNRLVPDFTVVRKIQENALTSVEVKADGYISDPLYHNTISMRMLTGILDGCHYVLTNAKLLQVPTFIAMATNDTVVCNKAICRFAADAADMVTLKEYASKHSVHNDAEQESFFHDMIAFLDSFM